MPSQTESKSATPPSSLMARAKLDERSRYREAAQRHPDALFSLTGRQLAAMLGRN